MNIEQSLWERIGAFDSASATSRERFSAFLIKQRQLLRGAKQKPADAVGFKSTNLYQQDAFYNGGSDLVIVATPHGIVAIGPWALEYVVSLFEYLEQQAA